MSTSKTKPKKTVRIKEDVREYRASDTHRVGQVIYHPVFEDTGKVKKKMKTPTGQMKKIVVQFQRIGEKELLTEYTPKTEEK